MQPKVTNAIWRTLTYGEWFYLLYGRPNAENLRSHATIPNLHGYILLPDNWETPDGLTFVPRAVDWETNTYSVSQWTKMEQAGAVFLPASGQRRDNQCGWGNTHGFYWTSSAANSRQAQVIHFNDTTIFANSRYQRSKPPLPTSVLMVKTAKSSFRPPREMRYLFLLLIPMITKD